MNEDLEYLNNINSETTTSGLSGFRKTWGDDKSAAGSGKFFACPFRHPMAGLLSRVKNSYDKFLSRAGVFMEKHSAGSMDRSAIKEVLKSEKSENGIPNPVPRKASGGTGGILMMLRHPARIRPRFN